MAITRNLDDQENVYMEIDLSDILGSDVVDRDDIKNSIASEIIDDILERADAAKIHGKKTYSDEYADSLEFDAYGKSKSHVDLKLTGGMHNALTYLGSEGNRIRIGWDEGSFEGEKAHGHITGAGGRLPVRDFFQISESKVKSIVRSYKDDLVRPKPQSAQDILDAIFTLGGIIGRRS